MHILVKEINVPAGNRCRFFVVGGKSPRYGFTLIELLIVVAVIGILAAIAIPAFSVYRVRSYNSSALSDLHATKVILESFYYDQKEYP